MSLDVDGSPATAEEPAGEPTSESPEPRPSPWQRLVDAVAQPRHVPFYVLLLGGIVLRYVTWRAYRPALLFPDSNTYLEQAWRPQFGYYQPSGYPAFLWPLVRLHHGSLIPLLQHAMVVAVAVAIYLVLQRWRVPAWGAALATVPVLFDPLQLDIEQMVLSDALFETLLCAAIVLVLWRRRPGVPLAAAAGVLVGLATLVRSAGTLLVVALVIAVVLLRARWVAVAAMVVAFVAPVAGYVVWHHSSTGHYAITDSSGRYLYARLSTIVDCTSLKVPDYERALCPAEPLNARLSLDHYMWSYHRSPQWRVKPPPGMTQEAMVKDFDRRVIRQQPLRLLRAGLHDLGRGFSWFRTVGPRDVRIDPFLFKRSYPTRYVAPALPRMLRRLSASNATVDSGKAAFLVGYQHWFHVPGPVLAVCLVLALLALVGVGRARRSGRRAAVWAFGATGFLALLSSAMAVGFTWRYQLPQLLLLPAAAALAVTALVARPVAPVAEEAVATATDDGDEAEKAPGEDNMQGARDDAPVEEP